MITDLKDDGVSVNDMSTSNRTISWMVRGVKRTEGRLVGSNIWKQRMLFG